jgi:tripartite-type tricarboxylate transporter receptor subunit TctC
MHLSMEWLRTTSGIDIVHVPYKTGAFMDLIAGRIQVMSTNIPVVLPHIRAGKVRALGVTSPTRSKQLPEVPTIAESGVPGYEIVVWYGLCAPAAVPRDLIGKINSHVVKALNTSDLRDRMEQHDFEARSPLQSSSPRSSSQKWQSGRRS